MTPRSAAATALTTALLLALAVLAGPPAAADPSPSRTGAAGIGDPYFPLDGNGGYDVAHYDLTIAYAPTRRWLTGTATIEAAATQALARFDLDLVGLRVSAITVDGRPATWTRRGQELIITPAAALRARQRFTTVVQYAGTPVPLEDSGLSGVIPTSDGLVIAGEPHAAASWFPVNDHPLDKAGFTFRVTVPRGLEVAANGRLAGVRHRRTTSTWTWQAPDPMAPYLATATIGQFDLRTSERDGVRSTDAIAPSLFTPPVRLRTGKGYAIGTGQEYYQRLSYTLDVPTTGANLSFWLDQDTDGGYAVVEAHTPGRDDWTTLRDANGHTSATDGPCYLLDAMPFLRHYLTVVAEDACAATGSTGRWWGSAGSGRGYQPWQVDLSRWRGARVEVSISHVGYGSLNAAYLDDAGFSTGAGRTSFEADGDTLDGWTIGAAPAGSPPGSPPWQTGGAADAPTLGAAARDALARQPEIITFLSEQYGPYPFADAGGIVDDVDDLGFALETQTRPIYAKDFFEDGAEIGTYVVVHETAHQWFGDSLSVQHWRDIWLNEGFARYAEWLWVEHEGEETAQDIFDASVSFTDDDFWTLRIGDPGAAHLFDYEVYDRGALTLHALRMKIGDPAFFALLQEWARTRAGGNVSTSQFVALAEAVSGQQLDAFFDDWLYSSKRPAGLPPASARTRATAAASLSPVVRRLVEPPTGNRAHRR